MSTCCSPAARSQTVDRGLGSLRIEADADFVAHQAAAEGEDMVAMPTCSTAYLYDLHGRDVEGLASAFVLDIDVIQHGAVDQGISVTALVK